MDASSKADVDRGSRIELLSAELADQIAAGEVVERPASVVKELVENAIDAGASRVEVELTGAGLERIVVRDDGRGVHPDDLSLCITRHATSKVRDSGDLIEVATLGFRGEALASIAAVADVTIESRTAASKVGTRMRSRPGLAPELEPVGMARGTRIDVRGLFLTVPARRKFMRSEATEVGHCSDAMLRLAVSNPGVHLRLRHGARELMDLPAAELPVRISQILGRKTDCELRRLEGEFDGVAVTAFLAPVHAAQRTGGSLFIVVRRRVVKERNISQIVSAAYGAALERGRHPLGAVLVEPPRATVDVNVHPQKAEVRFSDPQRVYAAVRQLLAGIDEHPGETELPQAQTAASVRSFTAAASASLDRWKSAPIGPADAGMRSAHAADKQAYRLRTRAADHGYAEHRAQVRAEVEQLVTPRSGVATATQTDRPTSGAPPVEPQESLGPAVTLLTCLPGPIAVLRLEDDLICVDLLRLRSHLVYRRLREDLGGRGRVVAQGLLSPVVVRCDPHDAALCVRSAEALDELGVVAEPFGADALMIRAVPAGLRTCVDEPDVEDLVGRIIPWLRMRSEASGADDPSAALRALALTRGADPAPRLARRWIRELIDEGVELAGVPGIARWTPPELVP